LQSRGDVAHYRTDNDAHHDAADNHSLHDATDHALYNDHSANHATKCNA
jgi:hypothetical protein